MVALLRSPLSTESDLAADLERLERDIQHVSEAPWLVFTMTASGISATPNTLPSTRAWMLAAQT